MSPIYTCMYLYTCAYIYMCTYCDNVENDNVGMLCSGVYVLSIYGIRYAYLCRNAPRIITRCCAWASSHAQGAKQAVQAMHSSAIRRGSDTQMISLLPPTRKLGPERGRRWKWCVGLDGLELQTANVWSWTPYLLSLVNSGPLPLSNTATMQKRCFQFDYDDSQSLEPKCPCTWLLLNLVCAQQLKRQTHKQIPNVLNGRKANVQGNRHVFTHSIQMEHHG